MPAPTPIETPRLLLRPLRRDDAEAMFALAQTENVTRYVTWSPHKTINETHGFIEMILAQYEAKGSHNYAITIRDNGDAFVGMVGCIDIHPQHQFATLGWWIGEPHWGRGYMTEAVTHLVDRLFRDTDVHRIEAMALAENPASSRVMEKAGMRYEGTLRDCRRIKGQFCTLRYYSILRSEWTHGS